jgi:hypothetical protein
MSPLDEAIINRRSERMLAEFGLVSMIEEKIRREHMPADDKSPVLLPIEQAAMEHMKQMLESRRNLG